MCSKYFNILPFYHAYCAIEYANCWVLFSLQTVNLYIFTGQSVRKAVQKLAAFRKTRPELGWINPAHTKVTTARTYNFPSSRKACPEFGWTHPAHRRVITARAYNFPLSRKACPELGWTYPSRTRVITARTCNFPLCRIEKLEDLAFVRNWIVLIQEFCPSLLFKISSLSDTSRGSYHRQKRRRNPWGNNGK